jgi:glutathione synthase/RimK-type ligase-like ATP-grasp enzyme
MYILPYKMASASAKTLAQELKAIRIKKEGSRFKGSAEKTVINWGCSEVSDEVAKCRIINKPEAVKLAANKLHFFERMLQHNRHADWDERTIAIPNFTTERRVAESWVNNGIIVVERHKLTGNSGEGIRLVEAGGEITDAPLYVKYIPKKQEYRVHVANGRVVDLQRKARRREVPDEQVNWRIRNHDNGFIFQRNNVGAPRYVAEEAVLAVSICGLDFGAVDVVYNEREGRAYVLEINTAPGLVGETLAGYVNRFKEWL